MSTHHTQRPARGQLELVRLMLVSDGVPAPTIDLLLRTATSRIFGPQQLIASTDSPLAGMILEGYAGALTSDDAGHEFVLTVLRRGQVFTSPFDDGDGPTIELVGLSRGVVLGLPADLVRRVSRSDHAFALRLLDWRGSVVERLLSRLAEVKFRMASERLAVVLLAYEPLFAKDPPLLPRGTLAGLIGTSREMLGSAIRGFEGQGVLRRSGRGLQVLDHARLREAARWEAGGQAYCLALHGPRGDDPLLDGVEVLPTGTGAATATSS